MKTWLLSAILTVTSATTFAASTPLVDFRGNLLPTTPMLNLTEAGVPASVTAASQTMRLYRYGTGPAPVANFGAIKSECSKLDPSHTECYTTSPFETSLVEEHICGYKASPAVILACTGSSCVSEVFVAACTTAFPERPSTMSYVAPKSTANFAGSLSGSEDFQVQSFSSKYDFTQNLNTAARVFEQGRTPILGLGWMLFEIDGTLKADARQILEKAKARYAAMFSVPGIPIEVIDEPFMHVTPESMHKYVNEVRKAIALLKEVVPNARLGTVVAPLWETNPTMMVAVESIAPELQWISTDLYMLSFADSNKVVNRAKVFHEYVKTKYPKLETWLIVQGFAPVLEKAPAEWTVIEINQFTQFLREMQVQASKYDGIMVWGWNAVNELQDQYAGKNFPDQIKNLYITASR